MFFSRIYFPLALGYAVSYFYRNINAIIEGDLVRELALGPGDLGLLTSVYFISFATFQIPLGILLDRYGPRRTECLLMLFAALGAVIFSQSESFLGLIIGRLLIGLGVSACLMGAFKAYVLWFPSERLALINGLQMIAGGIGALLATIPLQNSLLYFDWRSIFIGLSIVTLATSICIWIFLPEKNVSNTNRPSLSFQFLELRQVFKSKIFQKVAPLASISQGTILALHGLWIKPWLRDFFEMDEDKSAKLLFIMSVSYIFGFLILGVIAERLFNKYTINPIQTGVFGMMIFIILQIVMIFGYLFNPLFIVILLGFFGTSSVLVYAGYAQLFSKNLSGRVTTIQNLLVFLSAFFLQWGIGEIIQLWPSVGGRYDSESYQVALGSLVIIQILVLVYYFVSYKQESSERIY